MAEFYSHGTWTAKDGEGEQFVSAWTEFAQWLSTQPGAGTARLARDLSDPNRYLSFAPWESADAMHAWKSSPEFRERMTKVQSHVADFQPDEMELVVSV